MGFPHHTCNGILTTLHNTQHHSNRLIPNPQTHQTSLPLFPSPKSSTKAGLMMMVLMWTSAQAEEHNRRWETGCVWIGSWWVESRIITETQQHSPQHSTTTHPTQPTIWSHSQNRQKNTQTFLSLPNAHRQKVRMVVVLIWNPTKTSGGIT